MSQETPTIVTVEGLGRWAIGLYYGNEHGGEVHPFVAVDDDELVTQGYYYNSWDGEMYHISNIGDQCPECGHAEVTARIVNAENETVTEDLEFFQPDGDRIHRVKHPKEVLEWTD